MSAAAATVGDSLEGQLEELLQKARQLSQRVNTTDKKQQNERDAISEEVQSIVQAWKELRIQTETSDASFSARDKLAECEHAIRRGPGGDLRQHLKSRQKPLILRALLGRHCPVQAARRDEAFRCKQEYHSFRSHTARQLLVLSSLLVLAMRHAHDASTAGVTRQDDRAHASVLPDPLRLQDLSHHSFTPIVMVAVQIFLVYMTYIYYAMAARESVLLVNGSNIRPWWILHHYIAATTCVITLALPVDSPAVQRYVLGWMCWTIFQAVLMIVQNAYQRKRMYARIALGKDSALDVVAGETVATSGTLFILIPALVVLQAWQVYMGASMVAQTAPAVVRPEGWLEMERHESDLRGERGMFCVGALMVFMGCMNMYFTLKTVMVKRRDVRAWKARHVTSQRTSDSRLDSNNRDASTD